MRKSLPVLVLLAALIVMVGGGHASNGVTLTIWAWDPAFNIFALEEAAKIYNRTNPDVKFNIVETPWDDVQTKVNTAALSGQTQLLPDILLMQDNALVKNVINYPGLFADLTNSGIDYSQFADFKVAHTQVNGRNYAVPFDNGGDDHGIAARCAGRSGIRDRRFHRYHVVAVSSRWARISSPRRASRCSPLWPTVPI